MTDPTTRPRWHKRVGAGLALLPLTLLLTACFNNVQTFSSQCAYIIQHGYFDAHHVKQILLPGERANISNTTTRYVYCNARNYIVTTAKGTGDLPDPIQAKTAADPQTGDGTPVDVQLSAFFTLNQNRDAMLAFLPFCEKYNCFSDKDTTSNDQQDHSSSPGWNTMLRENMQFAITRATQHAMLNFPSNIWNDTSKWPNVADAITADFEAQMQQQTGSTIPFFCAQGATTSKCPPVKFSIEHVDPADPAIKTVYNQQVEQQYQQALAAEQGKTNAAQRAAAAQKYGTLTDYFLGLQDTIKQCQGNAQCVVSIGGGSTGVNVTPNSVPSSSGTVTQPGAPVSAPASK